MTLGDIMISSPKTLDAEASIHQAAQSMRDNDYGVIPIVDGAGSLVGIVTDRDIVIRAIAEGRGVDTPVRVCMTANPDTATRDTSIEQAITVMSAKQIRRLPVVEYGRLIGMVSLGDLAKSAAPEQEKAEVLKEVSIGGGEMHETGLLPET